MGIRSMNYLALRSDADLSIGVLPHLMDARKTKTPEGTLFVFESNFTPMWAREGRGEHCVADLESEIEIQRFLGTLEPDQFFMVRAGADAECGKRGKWLDHPFAADEDVVGISVEYNSLTRDVSDDETENNTGDQQGGFKYLDCSTGHITKQTMGLLNKGEESGLLGMTVAPYEYGAFVTVPGFDDPDDECVRTMPNDLAEVLAFAHSRGCQVVRFDSDGFTYDELPSYDW